MRNLVIKRFSHLAASAATLAVIACAASNASAMDPREFIDSSLPIPADVSSTVGALLPERVAVAATLLSDAYDPNIYVNAPATVKVTFLREGAGYQNTLGYFTYSADNAGVHILSRQLVFPRVKGVSAGGPLNPGDTVTLRDQNGDVATFPAGTRIGFFLVANGWNGTGVTGWDPSAPALPSTSPADNANVASGIVTTLDVLNPENSVGRPDVARHYVSLAIDGTADFLGGAPYNVVGIEDQRRDHGSDNDFNDVMF
ncbi:MAG TPA: DUF4114 domain-containing protein, partial [Byssovorax sp.]